ncbi:uncharacterized protein [Macaca fascicularis]|uniref:uncharacterized protein n=1 Tax=Macaca fascicularis TaxID=9541 RepID=UPI0032B0746E
MLREMIPTEKGRPRMVSLNCGLQEARPTLNRWCRPLACRGGFGRRPIGPVLHLLRVCARLVWPRSCSAPTGPGEAEARPQPCSWAPSLSSSSQAEPGATLGGAEEAPTAAGQGQEAGLCPPEKRLLARARGHPLPRGMGRRGPRALGARVAARLLCTLRSAGLGRARRGRWQLAREQAPGELTDRRGRRAFPACEPSFSGAAEEEEGLSGQARAAATATAAGRAQGCHGRRSAEEEVSP